MVNTRTLSIILIPNFKRLVIQQNFQCQVFMYEFEKMDLTLPQTVFYGNEWGPKNLTKKQFPLRNKDA